MIDQRKGKIVWICWAIVWPIILWIAYEYYYIQIEGQLIDLAVFAFFMFLVALFPLAINNKQIFFTNGFSIVVFVVFGLFVEIILTQLTIIVVLFNAGVRRQQSFRFPLNMLSFAIVSVIAAEVYRLLGGSHGVTNYENLTEIVAIFGYAITVFLMNQIFNKLIDYYLYQRKDIQMIDEGQKWELTSLLFILPAGYVLFILYAEIGRLGIFYLGIPFIFISIILQLLYSYQELSKHLERTSEIGHQLTKKLEKDEVYNLFVKEVTSLLPIDYAYIYMSDDHDHDYLKLKRFFDRTDMVIKPNKKMKRNEAISGRVWHTGEPLMFNHSKELTDIISSNKRIDLELESILSLPIEYDNKVIGVTTVGSRRKRAFEKFHFQLLDIVTTYLGVAIENAKNLELTKARSEIDGLTQLYNYHYFEEELNKHTMKLEQARKKEPYSLLLLDLDHFKRTNDTYGHEAGNEVLHQVAARLSTFAKDEGLVARYGGEEFAILLPGVDTIEASEMAQVIRSTISDRPFISYNHILDHHDPVEIFVTASIGVATYPVHCGSLQELIRHADRAMYIGAKNRGRDRVAIYEEIAQQ